MIDTDLFVLLDAIQRRGTMAAAAEELGKVPSALSYTVQKYEQVLGFALFRRQGRGVVFTEPGRLLLDRGRLLMAQTQQLADEAITLATGMEPRLRIAVEAWLGIESILPVLAALLEQYPELDIQLFEETLSGTWEALLEGRIDLAVGAAAPKPGVPGLQTEPIGVVDGVLAVSPSHPLAGVESQLTWEQLRNERWVLIRDSARDHVPRETLGIKPNRRLVVDSMHDKIAAQVAGLGIGFLPRARVQAHLERGELTALELAEPREAHQLLLAWRSDSKGLGLQTLVRCLLDEGLEV